MKNNSILKVKLKTIWAGFQKEDEIFFYFDDEDKNEISFKLHENLIAEDDNLLVEDEYKDIESFAFANIMKKMELHNACTVKIINE